MQAKYTPGPWTRYGTKVAAKCGPVGKIVGDTVIADCYGHRGLSDTERKDNAQLIAAAPDMAEALHNLREMIRGTEVASNCPCNSPSDREVCPIERAEAALRKAGL